MHRTLQQHVEVIPVVREQAEREVAGHAVREHRLGERLEATHAQPATPFPASSSRQCIHRVVVWGRESSDFATYRK